jgi:predicted glycosyl hydrolase (DUF1957 family)
VPGDHRYWRVTDAEADLGSKDPTIPEWAEGRVKEHAGNFLWTVKETLRTPPPRRQAARESSPPSMPSCSATGGLRARAGSPTSIRWMHHDPDLKVMTGEQLRPRRGAQCRRSRSPRAVGACTATHFVWHNDQTAWIWHRIYDAEKDMKALLIDHGPGHDEPMRTLVAMAGASCSCCRPLTGPS